MTAQTQTISRKCFTVKLQTSSSNNGVENRALFLWASWWQNWTRHSSSVSLQKVSSISNKILKSSTIQREKI
jgi:hypothetical protein